MIGISAQLSLYPLGEAELSPAIDEAIALLEARGLEVDAGPMSTVVTGDDEVVFEAIRDLFRGATERGEVVLVATFSNACPVPSPEA